MLGAKKSPKLQTRFASETQYLNSLGLALCELLVLVSMVELELLIQFPDMGELGIGISAKNWRRERKKESLGLGTTLVL